MDNGAVYEQFELSSSKHIDLVRCHYLCIDHRLMPLVCGYFSGPI